jgi:putative FmdB family regulatory protein
MPLYEYRCTKCRAKFEFLLRAKDKPPEKCQKCGSALVKLPSSPAIQFKGNGWYVTDYAPKSSPVPEDTPAPKHQAGKELKEQPRSASPAPDKSS